MAGATGVAGVAVSVLAGVGVGSSVLTAVAEGCADGLTVDVLVGVGVALETAGVVGVGVEPGVRVGALVGELAVGVAVLARVGDGDGVLVGWVVPDAASAGAIKKSVPSRAAGVSDAVVVAPGVTDGVGDGAGLGVPRAAGVMDGVSIAARVAVARTTASMPRP